MGTIAQERTSDVLGTTEQRRYSFEDPGLAVDPPIISRHPEDVAEVHAESDYRLYVRFFDGTAGIVEMRDLILGERSGVFAVLADPVEFAKVGIGFGTVMWMNDAWPTELDLAPDVMYEEFKRNGVWVVGSFDV